MNRLSVFRAVLSTLGKDLNAIIAFAKIYVYLAVLSIDLLFYTHTTVTHVNAVLDTAAF